MVSIAGSSLVSYGVKWGLIVSIGMSTLAPMKTPTTTVNLREIPKDLVNKLKAAAALEGASLKNYVIALFQDRVNELEKKGVLP
jgi:hypothetical protein